MNATQPPAGKVCEEYVRCIRRAAGQGVPMQQLLQMFPKLRRSAITCIINRSAWRNVL